MDNRMKFLVLTALYLSLANRLALSQNGDDIHFQLKNMNNGIYRNCEIDWCRPVCRIEGCSTEICNPQSMDCHCTGCPILSSTTPPAPETSSHSTSTLSITTEPTTNIIITTEEALTTTSSATSQNTMEASTIAETPTPAERTPAERTPAERTPTETPITSNSPLSTEETTTEKQVEPNTTTVASVITAETTVQDPTSWSAEQPTPTSWLVPTTTEEAISRSTSFLDNFHLCNPSAPNACAGTCSNTDDCYECITVPPYKPFCFCYACLTTETSVELTTSALPPPCNAESTCVGICPEVGYCMSGIYHEPRCICTPYPTTPEITTPTLWQCFTSGDCICGSGETSSCIIFSSEQSQCFCY